MSCLLGQLCGSEEDKREGKEGERVREREREREV